MGHADAFPVPLAVEENPVTPQQEERHIVDERNPQSQSTSLALIGPIRPTGPPLIGFHRPPTPPHQLRLPDEDEEMDDASGQNPSTSGSRDTTPRPRRPKGKGRMIYSDDGEEMENAGGNFEYSPAPQGQESQGVSGIARTTFSHDDSLLA